ncbi:hypothetical protein JNB_14623 [Janibacter sp. HTCC2649]|nr:hypothetical protein JNB_14623 [Janibacter sp. HTCC2649]
MGAAFVTASTQVERALLDTSVLIDPPHGLASLATEVVVSTISLAELAHGLHVPDAVESAARQLRYQRILDVFEPLPYSVAAARTYGALADVVRSAGRSPRQRRFDLLLASVAVSQGVAILTRNPRDFSGLHHTLQVVDAS